MEAILEANRTEIFGFHGRNETVTVRNPLITLRDRTLWTPCIPIHTSAEVKIGTPGGHGDFDHQRDAERAARGAADGMQRGVLSYERD